MKITERGSPIWVQFTVKSHRLTKNDQKVAVYGEKCKNLATFTCQYAYPWTVLEQGFQKYPSWSARCRSLKLTRGVSLEEAYDGFRLWLVARLPGIGSSAMGFLLVWRVLTTELWWLVFGACREERKENERERKRAQGERKGLNGHLAATGWGKKRRKWKKKKEEKKRKKMRCQMGIGQFKF